MMSIKPFKEGWDSSIFWLFCFVDYNLVMMYFYPHKYLKVSPYHLKNLLQFVIHIKYS